MNYLETTWKETEAESRCSWFLWKTGGKNEKNPLKCTLECGKIEESKHRLVKVHGEQLYKKILAGRLERVTRGVTSGFWEEWFVRHFGENASSSPEGKGKKLGKKKKKESLRLSLIGRAPEYICRQKRWVGWLVERRVESKMVYF